MRLPKKLEAVDLTRHVSISFATFATFTLLYIKIVWSERHHHLRIVIRWRNNSIYVSILCTPSFHNSSLGSNPRVDVKSWSLRLNNDVSSGLHTIDTEHHKEDAFPTFQRRCCNLLAAMIIQYNRWFIQGMSLLAIHVQYTKFHKNDLLQ